MPRKVEVPLPSRDVLAPARDILLFQGDYAIFYYVFLALYCAACCRTLRDAQPTMKWFHALPMLALTSFGGGIIVPITLGKPMVLHTNEAILPTMIIVWLAVNKAYFVLEFLRTRLGKAVSNTGFEVFRYHVLANCSDLASKALPVLSNGYLEVALVGPLLAGLIGGCGGAFMPLSNGLKAIETEVPWRVQSAAVMSVWHHFLMHDSGVRGVIANKLPFLEDTETVKCLGILFFVGIPALQAFGILPKGLMGTNPLVPKPKMKRT